MTHLSLPPSRRYHTDPSGTYVKYRCMAIGSGSEGAQTALQEHYRDDMSLAEAEVLALQTLKQVMEEKVGGERHVWLSTWHMVAPGCRCV